MAQVRFLDQVPVGVYETDSSGGGGGIIVASSSISLGVARTLNFTGSSLISITNENEFATITLTSDPFPYTGSAEITGSLYLIGPMNIVGSSDTPPLTVDLNDGNGDITKFQINQEGVMVLGQLDTTPTASTGGMFFSSSNEYFLGFS
jgi:hypothetical protein